MLIERSTHIIECFYMVRAVSFFGQWAYAVVRGESPPTPSRRRLGQEKGVSGGRKLLGGRVFSAGRFFSDVVRGAVFP